jgi:rhodanese-related sulfurtransferase
MLTAFVLAAAFGVGVIGVSFHHDVVRLFEARERLRRGGILLDVECELEFAERHPRRARNIPLDELSARAHELGEVSTSIVVYAHRWRDGRKAVHMLRGLGYLHVFDAAGVNVKERLSTAAWLADAGRMDEQRARGIPEQIELSPRDTR